MVQYLSRSLGNYEFLHASELSETIRRKKQCPFLCPPIIVFARTVRMFPLQRRKRFFAYGVARNCLTNVRNAASRFFTHMGSSVIIAALDMRRLCLVTMEFEMPVVMDRLLVSNNGPGSSSDCSMLNFHPMNLLCGTSFKNLWCNSDYAFPRTPKALSVTNPPVVLFGSRDFQSDQKHPFFYQKSPYTFSDLFRIKWLKR